MARIPERERERDIKSSEPRVSESRLTAVTLAADKGQEQRYLRSCICFPYYMGIGTEHCGEQKPPEASI